MCVWSVRNPAVAMPEDAHVLQIPLRPVVTMLVEQKPRVRLIIVVMRLQSLYSKLKLSISHVMSTDIHHFLTREFLCLIFMVMHLKV